MRGSVNTGFRAPTPGQSNASQVQTNIDSITGAPLTAGIIAPNNPVAQFFGAGDRQAGKGEFPAGKAQIQRGIAAPPRDRPACDLHRLQLHA